MSTKASCGIAYNLLHLEFHELNRTTHATECEPTTRVAPSSASSHIEESVACLDDDDEQNLISLRNTSEDNVILATEGQSTLVRPLRKKRYRFKSWKVGVVAAAITTVLVLLINLILTVWASSKYGLDSGIGTAYDGSCHIATAWSFWLHILINGMSSVLLSASNYTMQCVTAPTRRECDLAHSRGDWLDVGVPSIRNLFRISWQRRTMWALLALSSTPIHLLYNSAVFKTLDDNFYEPFLVGSNFLQSNYTLPSADILLGFNLSDIYHGSSLESHYRSYEAYAASVSEPFVALHENYLTNTSNFRNFSPAACIDVYATYYLSGHGNVILVAKDSGQDIVPSNVRKNDNLRVGDALIEIPFLWICAQDETLCTSPENARKPGVRTKWTIDDKQIEYCLSQDQPQHCKLQFSADILIAVIVCNIIKAATMFWIIWQQREITFITFGDAVASWLDRPDLATTNRCFQSVRSVMQMTRPDSLLPPQAIDKETRLWRLGVSKRRWIVSIVTLMIALVTSTACLGGTVSQMSRVTAETILSLGFGAVNSNMLLNANLPEQGTSGLASSVLFANLPQLILSFVYLLFNGLVTCMLLANEYSGYEVHRKSLRVTTPFGKQRSTYWLQIPFTYGIPMIAVSATLHWLISQSVFLVRVEQYDDGDLKSTSSISAVGLSPAPMLVVVVLGIIVTAIAVGMGYMKLEGSSMPVAASCSFALAAASHRPLGDVDAAVLPVKWGEVQDIGNADVGHCCFTSWDVNEVALGKKYA